MGWKMQFAKITTVGIFLTLIVLAGCKEDADKAANKLFVEASTAVAAYSKGAKGDASPKDQQAQLESAIADLNKITSQYPSTSVAVKVASTPKDSDIYLPRLEEELAKTKRAVYCQDNPTDISCRFDPLIQKQIAEFDPMNIGQNGQFLIFTLAATDRYNDLLSVLRQLKSIKDVDNISGQAIIGFCLSYGHADIIDKLNALVVAQGGPSIDEPQRAKFERFPKIIKASSNIPLPEIHPGTAAIDRVARLFALLQNGDYNGAQEEMKRIYTMVFDQSSSYEERVTAARILDLAASQFGKWSDVASAPN